MKIYLIYFLFVGNFIALTVFIYFFQKYLLQLKSRSVLKEKIERYKTSFEAVYNIVNSSAEVGDKFFGHVFKEIENGIGIYKGTIMKLNEETQILDLIFNYKYSDEYVRLKKTTVPSRAGRSIDGMSVLTKQVVVSNNTDIDPSTKYQKELSKIMGVTTFFSAPIIYKGKVWGALNLGGVGYDRFGLYELRFFSIIASLVAFKIGA
ncbi:MAG: GAF domain-containing protein [Patescibacteria group bacterium]|nr:GAF domain-containing protein [Patescibacteria group bacterium]